MILNGITWTPADDGEYNEHEATIHGRTVTVFSDRDEELWYCRVNDGDSSQLDAKCRDDAMREAAKEVASR